MTQTFAEQLDMKERYERRERAGSAARGGAPSAVRLGGGQAVIEQWICE
ncbi:hypothetical protein [Halostella pelagica]|nr:hypothetical protein [Halostella pelagica]